MGSSENRRQLRANHPRDTNSNKHHPTSRRANSSMPPKTSEGRPTKQETFERMRYGRLLVNTETYPCMKRACVALDAIQKSRIGQLQIRGPDHKNT